MLFFSDLDNTLIHSYKKAAVHDVCVETRQGKRLSFMPPDAYKLLQEVAQTHTFIPVTTRSLEQYRRIGFGFVPKYAIVAHGALLLKDGEVDIGWETDTRHMLGVPLPNIAPNEFMSEIRYVDSFFIFAKSDRPEEAVTFLKKNVPQSGFYVCAVHNKVYVLPQGLNKSGAMRRLMGKFPGDRTAAAGDSVLDVDMLRAADMAIMPETLDVEVDNAVVLPIKDFSVTLLMKILEA